MFKIIQKRTRHLAVFNISVVALSAYLFEMNISEAGTLTLLLMFATVTSVALSVKDRSIRIPSYDIKIYENGQREFNEFDVSLTTMTFSNAANVFLSLLLVTNGNNLINDVVIFVVISGLSLWINCEVLKDLHMVWKHPKELKVLSKKVHDLLLPREAIAKKSFEMFIEKRGHERN